VALQRFTAWSRVVLGHRHRNLVITTLFRLADEVEKSITREHLETEFRGIALAHIIDDVHIELRIRPRRLDPSNFKRQEPTPLAAADRNPGGSGRVRTVPNPFIAAMLASSCDISTVTRKSIGSRGHGLMRDLRIPSQLRLPAK
jgi:hypothetical protein